LITMPLKTQHDEDPQLNLISMIDVMLVLTIFFMCATKFAEEDHKIDIKLPTVSDRGALTTAPEPKVVNVYPDGRLTLAGKAVTLDELTAGLATARAQYPALSVVVRGDQFATHGRMTEVYEACKRAGVSELGIATQPKSTRTR